MTETANIAEALAAFQAEMPVVAKSKKAVVPTKAGGNYTYTYADLSAVTAAAIPILTKHGLAFSTCPRYTEQGYEIGEEHPGIHESDALFEARAALELGALELTLGRMTSRPPASARAASLEVGKQIVG